MLTKKIYNDQVFATLVEELRQDSSSVVELLHDKDLADLKSAIDGLVCESCEILDIIKRHLFYGEELDTIALAAEFGDLEHYKTSALNKLNLTNDIIRLVNTAKMKVRYPNGFNKEAHKRSMRDAVAEREAMEEVIAKGYPWNKVAGIFITLEGGEGSGKTSIMNMLKKKYKDYRNFHFLKDPDDQGLVADIRKILLTSKNTGISRMTEIFLYQAARAQMVYDQIRPYANDPNAVFISDRFDTSTYVYQSRGNDVPREDFELLHKMANGLDSYYLPDVVIYFDVDPKIGVGRSKKRQAERNIDETRFEDMDLAVHEEIRERYKNELLIAAQRDKRFTVIINNNGTFSLGQVFASVEQTIQDIRPVCAGSTTTFNEYDFMTDASDEPKGRMIDVDFVIEKKDTSGE